MRDAIHPPGFPPNPLYSQGMLAPANGRVLYVSGQVGVGADGTVGESIGEQARAAIANLNAVLAAAGMSAGNLVKTTIYLTDATDVPGFMEAAASTLPNPPPATTLLIVQALVAPQLKVEIEGIAVG